MLVQRSYSLSSDLAYFWHGKLQSSRLGKPSLSLPNLNSFPNTHINNHQKPTKLVHSSANLSKMFKTTPSALSINPLSANSPLQVPPPSPYPLSQSLPPKLTPPSPKQLQHQHQPTHQPLRHDRATDGRTVRLSVTERDAAAAAARRRKSVRRTGHGAAGRGWVVRRAAAARGWWIVRIWGWCWARASAVEWRGVVWVVGTEHGDGFGFGAATAATAAAARRAVWESRRSE